MSFFFLGVFRIVFFVVFLVFISYFSWSFSNCFVCCILLLVFVVSSVWLLVCWRLFPFGFFWCWKLKKGKGNHIENLRVF